MNLNPLVLSSLFAAITLSGCQTFPNFNSYDTTSAVNSANNSSSRYINNVHWEKKGDLFSVPNNSDLSRYQSRIVVFRQADDVVNLREDYQGSINIGIDDRFQTSLQPGQYSQSIVCTGRHNLSTEITRSKTNYLNNTASIETLQPKKTYYYQVIIDQRTSLPIAQPIDDATAISMLQNLPEQTHQISRVVQNNCQPVAQPAPTPTDISPEPIVVNQPIKLDVLFDFDSANIRSSYSQKIEAVVDFMRQHPEVTAVLEGHTDSKGNAAYNQRLSEQRAQAVKDKMVNQYGISSQRLMAQGYGESRPVATNDTEQGRQENRRVVAIISQ